MPCCIVIRSFVETKQVLLPVVDEEREKIVYIHIWLECRLSSCYGQRNKNKNAALMKNGQKREMKTKKRKEILIRAKQI